MSQQHHGTGELCNGSTYDSDSYCLGSNPSSPATCLHGQEVKTLPSQGRIMGSIPIGGASDEMYVSSVFLFIRKKSYLMFQAPLLRLCSATERRAYGSQERPCRAATVSQIWAKTKLVRLSTNTEAQKRSGPAAQRQFVKFEHRICCGAERPSHYS